MSDTRSSDPTIRTLQTQLMQLFPGCQLVVDPLEKKDLFLLSIPKEYYDKADRAFFITNRCSSAYKSKGKGGKLMTFPLEDSSELQNMLLNPSYFEKLKSYIHSEKKLPDLLKAPNLEEVKAQEAKEKIEKDNGEIRIKILKEIESLRNEYQLSVKKPSTTIAPFKQMVEEFEQKVKTADSSKLKKLSDQLPVFLNNMKEGIKATQDAEIKLQRQREDKSALTFFENSENKLGRFSSSPGAQEGISLRPIRKKQP